MSLYDIRKDIEACVDMETGEIIDEDRLNALQVERDEKISNIACWIKNLRAEANGIRKEKKELESRLKADENKADRLAKYLTDFLGGQKFHDARCSIGYRRTSHLEIADDASIPDEFLKRTVTVDKAGLTKAIKYGGVIEGVSLVEGQNIQIR